MATQLKKADEAQPAEQFMAGLRSFLQQHHPKDSRIIQAIAGGAASRRALQGFAKEVCAYSAISLRPIAALVSNAPDETSYRVALENFASEAGLLGTPPHPALFRDFTLGTGVTEEELDGHVPLPSTLGAMYTLERFLRGPFDEAIAGFGFAIEGPAAEWGRLVYAGLRDHYELDEKALMFWTLHFGERERDATLEEQHAANARYLMSRFASTPEQQERVGRAFKHSVLIFEHLWHGMDRFL
ncbi:MAG TPA: iron-containing redox enzyme family protein [Pyrinomonadaceae bacterium]|nr:iron-containing redox enzyme family protein [Pyrinomonadaceae bacterium]